MSIETEIWNAQKKVIIELVFYYKFLGHWFYWEPIILLCKKRNIWGIFINKYKKKILIGKSIFLFFFTFWQLVLEKEHLQSQSRPYDFIDFFVIGFSMEYIFSVKG